MSLEHWLYTIPLRLRSVFRRSRIEQELDEELRVHLEQRIAHEIGAGSTPEQARYTALRAMEGMEQRKEECRDMRRMNVFEDLQRNLRYAAASLEAQSWIHRCNSDYASARHRREQRDLLAGGHGDAQAASSKSSRSSCISLGTLRTRDV